jgi:hypothetical protein
MERGLSKNEIITQLLKTPHGNLIEYADPVMRAAAEEPEFFAHLIAWNHINGQVRDSKVALPPITLHAKNFTTDLELVDNSIAHTMLLDPRNLLKALTFARQLNALDDDRSYHSRRLREAAKRYLREREKNWPWWEAAALQHRRSMKELYVTLRMHPSPMAARVFNREYARGSIFDVVAKLNIMSAKEAAGEIVRRRIPFLTVQAALGAKMKEPDIALAMMEQMSPAEIVNNTNMLTKFGIKTNPVLRAAYESALQRVAESKKTATLKTTRAAAAVTDDKIKAKLQATQERQLTRMGGIDGDWLVAGDKSSSMTDAIETSRHVAATLARMVKGKVHLVFFDTSPRYMEVTGKDYDALLAETRRVTANGNTNIGCSLQYLLDNSIAVNGIVVVTDQEENQRPVFAEVYRSYVKKMEIEPVVYIYWLRARSQDIMKQNCDRAGIATEVFDLRQSNIDYYALPNLVKTMNAKRYTLIDQIMDTKLLRLDDAFNRKENEHAVA